MFRDPLLHLGARLLAGQRTSLDLRPGGLAHLDELPGEGCLFGRRVGTSAGTEPGTGAKLHPDTLSALEGAKLSHAAGRHHLPTTEPNEAVSAAHAHRTARCNTVLQGPSLQGAALQRPALQATELTQLLRTRQRQAAHMEALDLARLETGNVVDSGETIEPAAGLCVGRHRYRSECHGETKELDGAHLRLL